VTSEAPARATRGLQLVPLICALAGCQPSVESGKGLEPTLVDVLAGAPLAVAPFGPQERVADLRTLRDGLQEISGLAASRHHPGVLWAIADGKRNLYAIRTTPEVQVDKVDLRRCKLRDWEDLAWFEQDGAPHLLIADVGGNAANVHKRGGSGFLYVLPEPAPGADEAKVTRTITFALPHGDPDFGDIEAVAVDSDTREILIVKKRVHEKHLLVLDLDEDRHDPGDGDWSSIALPDPNPWETDAPRGASRKQTIWRRQPTGLDVHGREAVLLTYRHGYVYTRNGDESWREAFARRPEQLRMPFSVELGPTTHELPADAAPYLAQREAICFSPDGATVFVASEAAGKREPAWLVKFRRR